MSDFLELRNVVAELEKQLSEKSEEFALQRAYTRQLVKEKFLLQKQLGTLQAENTQQQAHLEELEFQNIHQRVILDELASKCGQLVQQSQGLLAVYAHEKEHENGQIVFVDNSKESLWDTSSGSKLLTTHFTVKGEEEGGSILSTCGFSTVPSVSSNPGSLIHNVHYYEVTIDEMPTRFITVGLVGKDYPLDSSIGCSKHSFGIGLRGDGCVFLSGKQKEAVGFGCQCDFIEEDWMGWDEVSCVCGCGFDKGNTIGCGIKLTEKTKSAEVTNCKECLQQQITVFFTKNGELMGTPIPLPSADLPSMLYPAITLFDDSQMTGNFGRQPFKYAIPPAKGLGVCWHCKK